MNTNGMSKQAVRDRLIELAEQGTRVALRTRMGVDDTSVCVGLITGITKTGSVMVENCGQLVPVPIEKILAITEQRVAGTTGEAQPRASELERHRAGQ